MSPHQDISRINSRSHQWVVQNQYGQTSNIIFKDNQAMSPVGAGSPSHAQMVTEAFASFANQSQMPTEPWSQHMLTTSNSNGMTTRPGSLNPMSSMPPRSPWAGPTIVSSTPARNQGPVITLKTNQVEDPRTAK